MHVVHVGREGGGGVQRRRDQEAVVQADAEQEGAERAALLGPDDAVNVLSIYTKSAVRPAEDEGGA